MKKNILTNEKEEWLKSEKSLAKENIELKEKCESMKLLKENENLLKEKKELLGDNEKLRKEIKVLKLIAKKFILSFQNLQSMINNNDKVVFNKSSLNPLKKTATY